jgi:hypothetical protein
MAGNSQAENAPAVGQPRDAQAITEGIGGHSFFGIETGSGSPSKRVV